MNRARVLSISDRSIELRKEGAEKMMRKRPPKGRALQHRRELNEDEMYRTPMGDKGHLWQRGTIFFECGRYVEYPYYYEEGWDHLLGPMWVQLDTRQRKNNLCSLCKQARAARAAEAERHAEIEVAARKYGVTPNYPAEVRDTSYPPGATRWLPRRRLEALYGG